MEINASVEINEEQTNENKQRLFIKACYSKGVSHHHLCVAEVQRQAERENFMVNKKGRPGVGSDWSWLAWELRSWLTGS